MGKEEEEELRHLSPRLASHRSMGSVVDIIQSHM